MKPVVLFLLLAALPLLAAAQSLQYTSNKIAYDNNPPVIAGSFKDTLHVIKKDTKTGFSLYLYNRNMEFHRSIPLQIGNSREQYEVLQVIAYTNFYYVVIGNRRREKAIVLKIYPSGKFGDETSKLTKGLQGVFPDHISISKFQKVEDHCVLTIMYYDSAQQKAYLSVHHLDSMLVKKAEYTVSLLYNRDENFINDVVFPDLRNAYILKSYRGFTDKAGQVDIFHYSFQTEVATKVTIAEKGLHLVNPLLNYNVQDSVLLFFATVRNGGGRPGPPSPNKYYYLQFNKLLEETSVARLLEMKIPQNEKSVFIIDKVHDVSITNINNAARAPNVFYNMRPPEYDPVRGYYSNERIFSPGNGPFFSETGYKRTDINLRLVWSDQKSGLKNDTLLTTKKTRFKAEYLNSFLFRSGQLFYIFYCINYSARGKTISYVSMNNGGFSDEEFLPVDHRYDYLLLLARKLNDNQLIIPYTYKGSLGFVRISLKR